MATTIEKEGVILVNERGSICSLDKGAARILRLNRTESLGRRLTEILPDTRLLEVLVSQEPLQHETLLNRIKVRIRYLPVSQVEGFSGVLVHIESLPAAIEEKTKGDRVLTDLYEGILADLPLGFAVVNRQGRVVFMNEDYSRILEQSPDEFLGLPLHKKVPFTQIREVLRSGKPRLQVELEYRGNLFLLSETPIIARGQIVGGMSKILSREQIEGQDFRNLLERIQVLENKLLFYKEEILEIRGQHSPLTEILGESPEMRKLKQVVKRVALHDANVLITGESGTGKGLLAQTIHQLSPRNGEPFIKINCAAIPENLLESELFGYEEGAFTGALKGGKPGKFELAQGGTIFLDEIGDMPLAMQAKILRVLQEKSFERVGGNKTLTVDVRVIAATHRDLPKLIEKGEFRHDLYYRLAVINLTIPPLRNRPEDLCHLTTEILRKLSLKYSLIIEGLTPEAENLLSSYSWPGNVRELENVLEYALNFLEPGERKIDISHLPAHLQNFSHFVPNRSQQNDSESRSGKLKKSLGEQQGEPLKQPGGLERDEHPESDLVCLPLESAVAQAEIDAILKALKLTRGNKQAAARVLGIHVSGLYQKLKKYASDLNGQL